MAEARQSSLEETCLTIFFGGGLAEPFKSGMPYWLPGESLEGYVNRALYLKGSSFRVEEAAMPSHTASKVVASAHGSPEAAVPAHRASCPFLGRPRLITSVQGPPLMSVQAALSARVLSKEVVPAHTAPRVHSHRLHIPRSGGVRPQIPRSGGVRPQSPRSGGVRPQSPRSGGARPHILGGVFQIPEHVLFKQPWIADFLLGGAHDMWHKSSSARQDLYVYRVSYEYVQVYVSYTSSFLMVFQGAP